MRFASYGVVVGLGIAVSCGLLVGETPYCPPECDCDIAKSSTAPCTTGVTLCSGVEPEWKEVNGEGTWVCGDATYVEPDWPAGCERSSWSYDKSNQPVYDHWTNCNKPNTNCSRPTKCIYVNPPHGCANGEPYGNWTVQPKPTQEDCQ